MDYKLVKKYIFNIFGILFSRISGFLRDLFIAKYLGAGIYSDMFFVAIKLPSVFRSLFTEGVFNQSFLPNLSKSNKKGEFCIKILIIFIAFLSLLALVISIFSNLFIKLIAYGFSDELITQTSPLLSINIWYLVLIFIASFLASILNYSGRFFITSISASFFNFACVFACILSKDKEKLEILHYISYFIIISSFVQIFTLAYALKENKIFKSMKFYSLNFISYFKNSKISLKGFFKNFFASLLGASSQQLNSLVEIALASSLIHSSISYLNYSTRIYQLPLALIAIAFTQVFFPTLIMYIKQDKINQAIKNIQKIFELMALLLILATIGGMILSEFIIKLLFLRGAFSYENAIECAKVLKFYMPCIIPLGLSKLFLAWINANYLHSKAAKISIFSCVIAIICSLIAINYIGIYAFCLSANISAWFIFLAYLKVFGYSRFLAILRLKNWLLITLISISFAYLLIFIKGYLDVLI